MRYKYPRSQTLRTSIIILFLSLTIIGFALVIAYTYSKNYKQILITSKEVAENVNEVILEKLSNISLASERMTQILASSYDYLGTMSYDNAFLKSLMLNILKYDPRFSNLYIGLNDGNLFGIFNLKASSQSTFIAEKARPLLPEINYVVRVLNNQSTPPIDNWYYLNEHFELIATEANPELNFKTLQRPWYRGAVEKGGLYWTNFYPFFPTRERGISVSYPIFDKKTGNILGVVGADLTFAQLTAFLQGQVIGKSGKAYMVERDGQIIIPATSHPKDAKLVSEVMRWYNAVPQKPDFVFKSEDIEYFSYVGKVPVIFGWDWRIVIIAPLKDFFKEMIKMQREVILIISAVLLVSSLIIAYFAKRISDPIVTLASEVNKIRHLQLESETRVASKIKEISLIDASIAAMRSALRSFACYVPKEVVKDLFQKGEKIHLGGQKKYITILFSDITGFTAIAETLPIDVIIPMLTEYFDIMTKIIHESHGTVDKFMGDGIIAFWGAPLDIPDHAARACFTALLCNAAIARFNIAQRHRGKPEFPTRFGINSGPVIVGNIGTIDRMNYTVIGDAVNLTARLQEVDKFYQTAIIISDDVRKNIGNEFVVRPLDVVNVKGRKEKIKIYELMAAVKGSSDIAATPEQIELCQMFTQAFEHYTHKRYAQAKDLLLAIQQKYPEDFPTKLLLSRIKEKYSS